MPTVPAADEMYVRAPGPRPLFQGDIYADVPFTVFGAGDTLASDPKWSAKRRYVAPILYPCDMVVADNVTPIKSQPIVQVYDAVGKGLQLPDDLDDVPVRVCPLPDLHGDGRMWVADFSTINVIHRSYLDSEKRVRCLSEYGWALFRQRLSTSVSRVEVPLEDVLELGAAAWAESEMETRWVENGRDRRTFHQWLDEPRDSLDHTSFRDALEAGELRLVGAALEAELDE